MYRPNFCSECGARVDRARWRLWTSTRFCAKCEQRLRKSGLAVPVLAAALLLGGGYVAGRAGWVPAPPVVIERAAPPAPTAPVSATPVETAGKDSRNETSTDTFGVAPPASGEAVSMCGARTQKGKPCSRRVRGGGRCWQHRGKSAMLPPEKLIIQE